MRKTIAIVTASLMVMGTIYAADPTPQPDKLKEALADLVVKTTQTLEAAKGSALEQAPEVFQQYLAWEYFKGCAWAVISGILMMICVAMGIAMIKDNEDTGGWFIFFAMLLLFTSAYNILDNVKIKTAPKVYLLEYAKSLLK